MTITQRTVYETEDGKQHETRADAEKHREFLAVLQTFEERFDFTGAAFVNMEDVVKWIVETYYTPKS